MRTLTVLTLFLLACSPPPSASPSPADYDLAAAIIRYWSTRPTGTVLVPSPAAKDSLAEMPWITFNPASQRVADSILAAGVPPVSLWAILEDDGRYLAGMSRIPSSLAEGFRAANRTPMRLLHAPDVPGITVSLRDSGRSSGQQPILYLSRPGFSKGRDSALVHVNEVCGGLCGEGTLILLVRTSGGWWVVETFGAEFS